MKNSADLGGCYPPRPSALMDNTLLDLQNSSYPTQPHSIIANYKILLIFYIRIIQYGSRLSSYLLAQAGASADLVNRLKTLDKQTSMSRKSEYLSHI